ncbi:hypothetical protein L873DRAFT_1283641 [Choiromyces venosus 120613-1]|uniref:Uncharacterized protein n=1 Tax=Choiromyces venosus 120613-1 TaxID=1336337 RepID=A0A3N4JFZ5_9PEZI|nr:hypothetical protein L873DRAFT_1283641 [Choiromyces venosus 120613-1]
MVICRHLLIHLFLFLLFYFYYSFFFFQSFTKPCFSSFVGTLFSLICLLLEAFFEISSVSIPTYLLITHLLPIYQPIILPGSFACFVMRAVCERGFVSACLSSILPFCRELESGEG